MARYRWLRAAFAAMWLVALAACGEGSAGQQRRQNDVGTVSDNTRLSGAGSASAAAREADQAANLPQVRDCVVRGGFAYVLVPEALVVVSLADPAKPEVVAREVLARSPERLAVDGVHAYVACGAGGLQVVSIGKPRDPEAVGTYAPEHGVVGGIAVKDGLAVALLPGTGIAVLDVSDPSQPKEKKLIAGAGALYDVAISEKRAYVVGEKLLVVDLSNPAEAAVIGRYQPKGVRFEGVAQQLSRTVVLTDQSLELLNLGSPERPITVARLGMGQIGEALGTAADDRPAEASPADRPETTEAGANQAPRIATATQPTGVTPAPTATDIPVLETATAETTQGDTTTTSDAAPTAQAAPAQAAAPAVPAPRTLPRLAVFGDRVVVLRSGEGIWVLNVEEHKTLKPETRLRGVDGASCVGGEGDLVALGTNDGRLVVFRLTGEGPQQLADVKVAERTEPEPTPVGGEVPLPISAEGRRAMAETPAPSTERPAGAPAADLPGQ